MTQKRSNKKAPDGDQAEMDVPEPPKPQGQKAAKAEENEEKKAEQLAKKNAGVNWEGRYDCCQSRGHVEQ